MRSFLIALALLMSPAFATIEPPVEFDRPHPNLLIKLLPFEEVQDVCSARTGIPRDDEHWFNGCAQIGDGVSPCRVTMREDYTEATYRHERAHCNGWRHD